MRFIDLSLERKIFVLSLLICLVPVIVFLFVTNTGSRLTFQETIGNELNQDARQIGLTFDQFISRTSRRLSYRFAHPSIRPAGLTANRGLELADPDAVITMKATGEISIEMLSQDLARWREQIEMNDYYFLDFLQLPPGALPFEGTFQDFPLLIPGSTSPVMLGVFVLPKDDGYVFLLFRIERIIEAFRAREMQIPDLFMIFSSNGRLVYTSEPISEEHQLEISHQLNPALTNSRYFQIRLGQRIYLMSPYIARTMQRQYQETRLGSYWIFLATYDMEPFLRPQETLFSLSWIIALVLALVLLFLASFSAKYITEPLLRLRRQADQIAGGQLDVQATVQSHDEIGELALAFNQMASRLRQSYTSLEERIKESRLRADHINIINQIIFAINQAHDMDSIFRITSLEMQRIFQYDAFWLAMRTETGDLTVTHIDPEGMITLFDQGRIPRRNSLHGQVLEAEETVHAEIGPRHRTEFYETRIFNAEGLQSYLISPLPGRHRIIGSITVASTAPDAFNAELSEIFTSLAASMAVALEQMDMNNRLSQFAHDMELKVEARSRELEVANQKLIQTEKYFATGRMAGNLAHEINNPLEIIKNYLQLVKNRLNAASGGRRSTDPNIDHVQIIDEEVNRIARLVRQMMDLHRPAEQSVQPIDINALFEEILALMMDTLTRHKIQVVREFQPDLPRPVASRDLIRQVLINLMRNSQDAMEAGGTLTLGTRAPEAYDANAEQHIEIIVADTGHGISRENLNNIFDPFFTTKSQEKGTGLGLCVSFSIVQMYGGSIEVDSTEGIGTTMRVILPIQREKSRNRDALTRGTVIPISTIDSH